MIDLKKSNWLTYVLLGLIVLLVASIFILASVPPVSRDALTHHLYIPKLWLQNGNISPVPSILFSYYPMNLDLLYAIPLALGNDIIPKYIHFFFALFTAGLIFIFLRKKLSVNYGLLGALFFLSLPIIIKLSITVYVDLGLVAFTTASLLLLLVWCEEGRLRYLIWAGVFCGLAAGTKYNGLVAIFLLTLLVPILYMRSTAVRGVCAQKAIGYGVLFFAVVLAVYSPWLIRNYVLTGNPIYPLHDSFFNNSNIVNSQQKSENSELIKPQKNKKYSAFQTRHDLYGETWWQALLLPVRFFLEGKDNDPRYFDGRLNPFLFILPFFAFWRMRNTRQEKIEIYVLFSFAWLYFFFVFFQSVLRIRYIAPAIPPLVILSILGLANISEVFMRKLKKKNLLLMSCIVVLLLGYNFSYLIKEFAIIQPLFYLQNKDQKDVYITHFRGEYPVQQFANSNLKKDDTVLAINIGNRGYYFDIPVVFDKNDVHGIFIDAVMGSNSSLEIKNKLTHSGFSHLFIRLDLFLSEMNRLIPVKKNTLVNQFFQQNTKQLFYKNDYILFKIVDVNSS